MRLRELTTLAMLTAIAALLMQFVQFPIIPGAPYLRFDPSEVPTLLAGVMFGPLAAVAVALLKNVVRMLLFGSATGWIGPAANFIAVGLFVGVASWVYWRRPTTGGLARGVALGAVVRTAAMVPVLVFFILPVFFNYSPTDWAAIQTRVLPLMGAAFVPFNLVTSVVNGALTLWMVALLRDRIPTLRRADTA
ncbi:MAG: ECF transporter S component [Armatimonadota bacterium]|nr:ECF transporter S component [Armatimonadota bacterium]MDR5696784.1 ECF transporter S component [Armatimonadota bacterium]